MQGNVLINNKHIKKNGTPAFWSACISLCTGHVKISIKQLVLGALNYANTI
jgi:hypothetical protein